jgi:hypothetical protein
MTTDKMIVMMMMMMMMMMIMYTNSSSKQKGSLVIGCKILDLTNITINLIRHLAK